MSANPVSDISEARGCLCEHGYELLDLIGCGHFAACYTVRDNRYDAEVFCVKIIALTKNSDENVSLTFHAELDTLMSLTHPNIITIYAHFASPNYLYLVLEYCEKGALENIIKGEEMPADTLRDYCKQLATAMAYLHSRNFCHRDIKPANILMDKYGRLKLADFGFACSYTEKTGSICGSVPYMSPELIDRRPCDPMANDMWALGVTFYEMAFGALPWTSRRAQGMSAEIIAGAVQIPVQTAPNFMVLLKKMMNMDPAKRGTMQEILRMPFFSGARMHTERSNGSLLPTIRPTSGQQSRHRVNVVLNRSPLGALGTYGKHVAARPVALVVPEDDY
jgi:serine/threonine protein kinase